MKETIIQKGILDYLGTVPGIYFFRSSSGAVTTSTGRFFKSGKKGCPDISMVMKSVYYGLEVKNEKGRQSAVQKQAQKEIEEAGGKYYIVRSIADIKEIIND